MMRRGEVCPNCAFYNTDLGKCGVRSKKRSNGSLHFVYDNWRNVFGGELCDFTRRRRHDAK